MLRAGETATLRVRLLVGTAKSEVTVYGTTERRAQRSAARHAGSTAIRSTKTPILGNKITYLPLLNSAFRSGQRHRRSLHQRRSTPSPAPAAGASSAFAIDGATGDEPWGRQTMFSTIPVGAVQEMNVLSNAFSAEFGWTASPAVNVVTKAGTNSLRGEDHRISGVQVARAFQERTYDRADGTEISPGRRARRAQSDLGRHRGSDRRQDQTFFFGAGEFSNQDRTAYFANIPATTALAERRHVSRRELQAGAGRRAARPQVERRAHR